MNVSPKQLRIFLALAESLNFSKTAEKLFMTQPSLSKSIRELEESLGIPLFERSTRHVRITESGTRLASIARAIIGEYDNGMQRMQSSAEHEALLLSVAAWPSLAHVLIPEMCALLEQRFGAPRITVLDAPNSRCIDHVMQYQADLAFASIPPSHPDLAYQELMRDRFVVLSGERWRAKTPQHLKLHDLIGMPILTLSNASTAWRYMSAAYLSRGIDYQPKMQLEQISSVIGLVQAGVGVAVLPYLGVLPSVGFPGVQLSEIIDGPLRSIGVIRRRIGKPTALAEAAIEVATTVCAQLRKKHPRWILPATAKKHYR
jgi:LysR family carnitine catabolism transcriptional activator